MKHFRKLKMLGIGTGLAAMIAVTGGSAVNALNQRALLVDYSNTKLSGPEVGAIVDTYSEVWVDGSKITGVQTSQMSVDIGYISNRYCYVTSDRKAYVFTADIRLANKWDDFTDTHRYFK